MPSPRNPNPLSVLDFIIYPVAILIGCWGLSIIGELLGLLFGGPID